MERKNAIGKSTSERESVLRWGVEGAENEREAYNFPHLDQLKIFLNDSGLPILGHKAVVEFVQTIPC